jgi:RHS repeat-associated protein
LDSDGYLSNEDGVHGTWHYRKFDLSGYAGKTISAPFVLMEACTQPGGAWDIYFADLVLVSADGTTRPLYTRQPSIGLSMWGSSGVVNPGYESQNWSSAWPEGSTTYYHQDHLGTSRLITGYGGWPVWSGTFAPFGQEVNPEITTNTYKFTGDEHDAESNLEHTQFRQLSTTQGRWLSPDPYLGSIALANPQSLNRYSYVLNEPLRGRDPLGLECVWDDGSFDSLDDVDTGSFEGCQGAGGAGGTWVDHSYFVDGGLPDWNPNPSSDLASYAASIPTAYADNSGVGTAGSITAAAGILMTQIGLVAVATEQTVEGAAMNVANLPEILKGTQNPRRLFNTNYCGPGGAGPTRRNTDPSCKAHDHCFDNAKLDANDYVLYKFGLKTLTPGQVQSAQQCNQQLCASAGASASNFSDAAQVFLIGSFFGCH